MEKPLQMTFRGVEPSDAVKQTIEEQAEKLERFFDKIESCRVVVEPPPGNHHKGGTYQVKIRLTVPGDELVVSHDRQDDVSHQDLEVAVFDAFKEMTRELQDYVRRRRGQTKTHEAR